MAEGMEGEYKIVRLGGVVLVGKKKDVRDRTENLQQTKQLPPLVV